MGKVTTNDGTKIFSKDWGSGQPVVFSHGWPLNADAWDDQAFLMASNGFRQIVPVAAPAQRAAELVKDATLKVYPGAPHGLANLPAFKDTFNADLLDFIRS